MMAKQAVIHGFSDPSDIDIDSTVQEANMHYPADSCLLKKLGAMSNKIAPFLNKTCNDCMNTPLQVNMKKISATAREYFFLPKNSTKDIKNSKLMTLLNVVIEETLSVIECCKNLSADFISRAP